MLVIGLGIKCKEGKHDKRRAKAPVVKRTTLSCTIFLHHSLYIKIQN